MTTKRIDPREQARLNFFFACKHTPSYQNFILLELIEKSSADLEVLGKIILHLLT